jgi:hypothetical protein
MKTISFFSFVVCVALIALPAWAEANLVRRATRLEPLSIDAVNGFSVQSYTIEAGVYYRWRIESDGREEYSLVAPRLFQESWVDQVVIEDLEVRPSGLYSVEFDDAGTMDIWFVTLRAGTYFYYVEGLETQGFRGEFVVK